MASNPKTDVNKQVLELRELLNSNYSDGVIVQKKELEEDTLMKDELKILVSKNSNSIHGFKRKEQRKRNSLPIGLS